MAIKKSVYTLITVVFFLTLLALFYGQGSKVNFFLISNDLNDINHNPLNSQIASCEPVALVYHSDIAKAPGLESALNALFKDKHNHRNGKKNPLRESNLLARIKQGEITSIYLHGQITPISECELDLISEQIKATIDLYLNDQPYIIYLNGEVFNFTELTKQT